MDWCAAAFWQEGRQVNDFLLLLRLPCKDMCVTQNSTPYHRCVYASCAFHPCRQRNERCCGSEDPYTIDSLVSTADEPAPRHRGHPKWAITEPRSSKAAAPAPEHSRRGACAAEQPARAIPGAIGQRTTASPSGVGGGAGEVPICSATVQEERRRATCAGEGSSASGCGSRAAPLPGCSGAGIG